MSPYDSATGAAPVQAKTTLIDPFGRSIDYLRV